MTFIGDWVLVMLKKNMTTCIETMIPPKKANPPAQQLYFFPNIPPLVYLILLLSNLSDK